MVTVQQVPPTIQLSVQPTTINVGQSATITWSTTNATSLTLDNGIGSVTPVSGTVSVTPSSTTTYTATATGPGGSSTAQVTVTVSQLNIQVTASPTNIQTGQSATISYTSNSATSISFDNGIGSVAPPSGSFTVSPTQTTIYTATATDASGNTRQAQVTVFLGSGLSTLKHIIYLVQENRSFDSYFGKLGLYKASRGYTNDVDGVPVDSAISLQDLNNQPTSPYHYQTECTENLTPAWNESHYDVDFDSTTNTYKMDNFLKTTNSVTNTYDPAGHRALGYYDQTDLPYYYELATQFGTSDRWFSPLLANTIPNRMYLFAGTSYGTIYPNSEAIAPGSFSQPTIFDQLNKYGVSWRYYYQDDSVFLASYSDFDQIKGNVYPISDYFNVLSQPNADGQLPQVIFIERGAGTAQTDEHPLNNVQVGSATAKQMIDALMASPVWADSAFILTFDEGGGLYDHVPPQPMPLPDSQPPYQGGETFPILPGTFNQTGFRVPLIVISPWAKPHFTSHVVRDTTAILKLLEDRFSMPSLTARDAAQDDMSEFFDFSQPSFATPPALPAQPTTGTCDPTKEAQ